jgi:Tfp pilus assembly protein PilF
MNVGRMLTLALAVTVLYGCACVQQGGEGQPPSTGERGEQLLLTGIRAYENGKYNEARKALETSLKRGLGDRDQVQAYKYLAFIDCISNEDAKCRSQFRMALTIDPRFELAPAEAGHPIWGPVFRSVKDQR